MFTSSLILHPKSSADWERKKTIQVETSSKLGGENSMHDIDKGRGAYYAQNRVPRPSKSYYLVSSFANFMVLGHLSRHVSLSFTLILKWFSISKKHANWHW